MPSFLWHDTSTGEGVEDGQVVKECLQWRGMHLLQG